MRESMADALLDIGHQVGGRQLLDRAGQVVKRLRRTGAALLQAIGALLQLAG